MELLSYTDKLPELRCFWHAVLRVSTGLQILTKYNKVCYLNSYAVEAKYSSIKTEFSVCLYAGSNSPHNEFTLYTCD